MRNVEFESFSYSNGIESYKLCKCEWESIIEMKLLKGKKILVWMHNLQTFLKFIFFYIFPPSIINQAASIELNITFHKNGLLIMHLIKNWLLSFYVRIFHAFYFCTEPFIINPLIEYFITLYLKNKLVTAIWPFSYNINREILSYFLIFQICEGFEGNLDNKSLG